MSDEDKKNLDNNAEEENNKNSPEDKSNSENETNNQSEVEKKEIELESSEKLSPEEEARQIELTRQAIENRRRIEEDLESEAGSLIAHGDFVLQVPFGKPSLLLGDDLNENFPLDPVGCLAQATFSECKIFFCLAEDFYSFIIHTYKVAYPSLNCKKKTIKLFTFCSTIFLHYPLTT